MLILIFHDKFGFIFSNSKPILVEVNKLSLSLHNSAQQCSASSVKLLNALKGINLVNCSICLLNYFSPDVKGRSESTSDKGVDKSEERENVVSADVLDEKDIIANGNHDLEDGVERNVVSADVSNGKDLIANENHVLEDHVEENEVTVEAEGVSGTIDSKESAIEDAQNSSEKAHVEPISSVGANVQNSLAEPMSSEYTEDSGIPVEGKPDSKSERPEEESGMEKEAKPSNGAVPSEMEPSIVFEMTINLMEIEAEPSNNTMWSEDEPSVKVSDIKTDATKREAEPSNGAAPSESEPSIVSEMINNVVQFEGELSKSTVQSEVEPSMDESNMETNVVGNEAEPSGESEFSNHENKESRPATDAVDGQKYGIRAERAARDLLKSKRQEMDLVQSKMNRLNNAISVGDIDDKVMSRTDPITIRAKLKNVLPHAPEKQLVI
ncbi:hypothetical protein RJT34_12741 [Clitoria ternatea]|uniref:Uncharacterized protein n=1 Tax=Clitoria ternatea TaxID=43366 RepID=A0AAN9PJL3_CLITE